MQNSLQLLARKITGIFILANVLTIFIFYIKLPAMKKITVLLFVLALALCANAQSATKTAKKSVDEIRKYYFVMLHKGPNRNQDSAAAAKIQEGHMANINHLYKAGKLKVAGPFGQKDSPGGDDGDWMGIFIFDCATQEEVEGLLKTDPAVAAGRLTCEIRPWYTAAVGSFKPGKP
jgi:uncharacterized protein YciI